MSCGESLRIRMLLSMPWPQSAIVALTLAVVSLPVAAQQETGFLNRTVSIGGKPLRYQVYLPFDYTPAKQWPVFLFLHGAGERGTDGLRQTQARPRRRSSRRSGNRARSRPSRFATSPPLRPPLPPGRAGCPPRATVMRRRAPSAKYRPTAAASAAGDRARAAAHQPRTRRHRSRSPRPTPRVWARGRA